MSPAILWVVLVLMFFGIFRLLDIQSPWLLLFFLGSLAFLAIVLGAMILQYRYRFMKVVEREDSEALLKLVENHRKAQHPNETSRVLLLSADSLVLIWKNEYTNAIDLIRSQWHLFQSPRWRAIITAQLAWAYSHTEQHDLAIDTANEAVELAAGKHFPEEPTIIGTLGVALHLAGRHQEAIPLLNDAIQRLQSSFWTSSNGCSYAYYRGMALIAEKQTERGKDSLELATKLNPHGSYARLSQQALAQLRQPSQSAT